ncbi:hypothetical protein [Vreelandella venusta]|uniref:hypothetical protein n=1 Tax=Vreelandella venusta TaxID=44935 RepID=UPI0018DAD89F|nr:hypothetical protein [Halomonas venusta]QPI64440.1 hypothetical protein IR195_01540 [Halomonas venusta]
MSNVTPIQSAGLLPQAHRDAMAYIQNLAITISQRGVHAVNAEYCGQIHQFSVCVLRFSEIAEGRFKADVSMRIQMPSHTRFATNNALEELQAIARELEALLIPPTGGTAA